MQSQPSDLVIKPIRVHVMQSRIKKETVPRMIKTNPVFLGFLPLTNPTFLSYQEDRSTITSIHMDPATIQ